MSNPVIERVVTNDEASGVFALAEWVLSIPRIQPEAVTVFGCLELLTRTYAIKRWRLSEAGLLFFAGTNPNEKKTFDALTPERLRQDPYNLTVDEITRTVTQVETENTKTQAQWLVNQIGARNIRVCELIASPYHIVRAFATVVSAMGEARFILIPHPTPMSPTYLSGESNAQVIDMTAGEYQRIVKYQPTGDVATLAQLKEYLEWLWQQPELAEFK